MHYKSQWHLGGCSFLLFVTTYIFGRYLLNFLFQPYESLLLLLEVKVTMCLELVHADLGSLHPVLAAFLAEF